VQVALKERATGGATVGATGGATHPIVSAATHHLLIFPSPPPEVLHRGDGYILQVMEAALPQPTHSMHSGDMKIAFRQGAQPSVQEILTTLSSSIANAHLNDVRVFLLLVGLLKNPHIRHRSEMLAILKMALQKAMENAVSALVLADGTVTPEACSYNMCTAFTIAIAHGAKKPPPWVLRVVKVKVAQELFRQVQDANLRMPIEPNAWCAILPAYPGDPYKLFPNLVVIVLLPCGLYSISYLEQEGVRPFLHDTFRTPSLPPGTQLLTPGTHLTSTTRSGCKTTARGSPMGWRRPAGSGRATGI
jgi:hypothetical protein